MGPRNVDGGNRAKRQGRKYQNSNSSSNNILRKSASEMELYAVVTKMSGGNLCRVVTQNGDELCCHMGGKFRGRNKRQNFVKAGEWVLVGLREWEKNSQNCDLEYVYSKDEIEQLRELPGVNLKFLKNQENVLNNITHQQSTQDLEEELGFVFSDKVVSKTEINNIISGNVGNVVVCQTEEINIDDL
jgi:initiation factor 1A